VVTRLAERLLLVMAKATDGRYFRSESINLNQLVAALDQLQKKSIGGSEFVEYEERYQSFLLAAFLLILAGLGLSNRRGAWLAGFWRARSGAGASGAARATSLRTGSAAVIVLGLLGLSGEARADVGASMRRGLALEQRGKLEDALQAYQQALVFEPDNVRIHYDIGRALDAMKRPKEAADEFQLSLLSKSRPLRAKALYNLGNTQYQQGHLDEAIASYSQALLFRPGDLHAKQNLELCWKKKAEQKPQPDSTGQQPKQPPRPQQRPSQPQQAQPQKGAISKEQADRMLQALQSKERENLKNQPKPPVPSGGGKDW
jgi:tetratricopeptide (TPR) repeat protein